MTDYRNNLSPLRLVDHEWGEEGHRSVQDYFRRPWVGIETASGHLKALHDGTAVLEDVDSGRRYRVGFEVGEAGARVVEVGIIAAPGESLTARKVAEARLGSVIDQAAMMISERVDPTTGSWPDRSGGEVVATPADLDRVRDRTKRPRGRPPSVGDEQYQLAADAYRDAQRRGVPTTAALAQALGVSLSTARKRVMGARERGMLPAVDGYTRPRL